MLAPRSADHRPQERLTYHIRHWTKYWFPDVPANQAVPRLLWAVLRGDLAGMFGGGHVSEQRGAVTVEPLEVAVGPRPQERVRPREDGDRRPPCRRARQGTRQ